MFVIKKEEIKKDIVIKFEDNVVYGDIINNPFVSFIDGELVIDICNCKIFMDDTLADFKLKKDYLDKFVRNL